MIKRMTAVLGNSQRLDGGAMFGNAPKALWQRWIVPDAENRIPLSCRCLLVQDKDDQGRERTLLFETGVGAFFPPEMRERYGVVEAEHCLLNNLEKLGVAPEQIDWVVLSHVHFDHAGGLLHPWQADKPLALCFPNARFLVSQRHWQRAQQPHVRDRASFIPELNQLLASSGRLVLMDNEDQSPLGESYKFHFSDGHTPGLMLTEFVLPDGPLVFAADLIPGALWVHLPITMGYDRFPEQLINEKQKLLDYLIENNGALFFTHDHQVAVGKVARDSKGKYSVIETQQEFDYRL